MTGDQLILAAASLVVVLGVLVLMVTAPGGGLTPGMVVALWAYAPPLYRRHAAKQYHRDGAHRHARPSRWRRVRALARRVLASRLRRPAAPADTVPISMVTTLPDLRQFVRPTC